MTMIETVEDATEAKLIYPGVRADVLVIQQ